MLISGFAKSGKSARNFEFNSGLYLIHKLKVRI